MLTLIIPTLNAATTLPAVLGDLTEDAVVVSDGGSTDGTAAVAEALGARVIAGPPGRGLQLVAGGQAAATDWLLFLHADTRLAPGWRNEAARFMADPDNAQRAAYFRLKLDHDCPAARRVVRLANWRARRFGLPYGDQGLLISKAFYDALGGYAPLPLMEDVDLARRIGRARFVPLETVAVTSARRYRDGGYWRRPLRNLVFLGLYLLGVNPATLAARYG